ncbi:MAG: queuosine precursor transporter [Bacteroidales bacterium]|nr:queuosine precursor transporter [Bacteroidales bacterium]
MKQKVSVYFMLLGILFNVCLITSNLLGTKVINLFGYGVTGGLLVFPLSYIINDCVSEVWGYKKARLIIWTGFLSNFFVVLLGLIAVVIPPAPYWEGAEHFNFVFGFAPRIAIASLLAFVVGSFLNAYVMSRMKLRDKEKRFSLRAIVSTLVGETSDSIIFFPIAFGGVLTGSQLLQMMLLQIVLKTAYEIIILPVTIRVVKKIKSLEGTDVYDENISYNIWKVKEL